MEMDGRMGNSFCFARTTQLNLKYCLWQKQSPKPLKYVKVKKCSIGNRSLSVCMHVCMHTYVHMCLCGGVVESPEPIYIVALIWPFKITKSFDSILITLSIKTIIPLGMIV